MGNCHCDCNVPAMVKPVGIVKTNVNMSYKGPVSSDIIATTLTGDTIPTSLSVLPLDDEQVKNSDMPGEDSTLLLHDEQIKNSDMPHKQSTGTILLDENDVAQEKTCTDLISHMEHDNGNFQSDENDWQENVTC